MSKVLWSKQARTAVTTPYTGGIRQHRFTSLQFSKVKCHSIKHLVFLEASLSLVQFSVRSILTQPFHKNKSHFRIRSTNTISLNLSHLYKVSMLKYDPILSYQELASQHKNSRRIQLSSQQIKRLSPTLSTLFGIEDDENELFLPFFRQNLKKKQLSQVKDYKQKHQYFLLLTVLCAHCIWFFLMIKLDNHVPT